VDDEDEDPYGCTPKHAKKRAIRFPSRHPTTDQFVPKEEALQAVLDRITNGVQQLSIDSSPPPATGASEATPTRPTAPPLTSVDDVFGDGPTPIVSPHSLASFIAAAGQPQFGTPSEQLSTDSSPQPTTNVIKEIPRAPVEPTIAKPIAEEQEADVEAKKVTDTLELEKQAEAARLLQEADAAKAKKAAHAQEQAKKAAKREKFVKEKKEMLAERKKERAATRAKQAAEAAEARVRQEQDSLRELEAEAAQAQKAAEAQAKQEQDALREQQAKAAEEKKVADAHLKKVMDALKKAGDDQAKLNADASAEEKAKEAKPADDGEEMTEAPLLTGEDGEYPAGLFSDGEDSPMSSDDEDVLGKGGKWENVFPQEDIDMGGMSLPQRAHPSLDVIRR
jgi:hypothetical protein